jgi:crotonobetainyl-CoA:carnitine CoA-transferase CaiB-like acyl-CoA transferase
MDLEGMSRGMSVRRATTIHEIGALGLVRARSLVLIASTGYKSVTLNLESINGRDLAREIAAKCDVVIKNFEPGGAEQLGLSFSTLSEHHLSLVYWLYQWRGPAKRRSHASRL